MTTGHARIERVYEMNDRLVEIVFRSVCLQYGIETRRDDRGPGIVATGSDKSAFEDLDRTMAVLLPQFEAELIKLTKRFVFKATGERINIQLAKPAP